MRHRGVPLLEEKNVVSRSRTVSRLIVALGVVAGLTQLAPAAAQSSGAPAALVTPGWVTGTVVDEHGNPIRGALVNVLGPREVPEVGILAATTDRRDWTDSNGRFKVRQGKNDYLVQICHPEEPGAETCRETARGVPHLITYVGPAGVSDSWVLHTSLFETSATDRKLGTTTVKPQGYVHGRIRRASFQPINLLRLNGTSAYHTETDANGRYMFQGLAPGQYRVAAGGAGWLRWQSKKITVEANHNTRQDGRIRKGGRVTGVLSSRGKPVSNVDVIVRTDLGQPIAAATTNAKGIYRVAGLTVGDYRVGVEAGSSAYRPVSRMVHVPSTTALVKQNLVARKGAVITLKVAGVRTGADFRDELRNSSGRPIRGLTSVGAGKVRYEGLTRGTYVFVGATKNKYVTKEIVVGSIKRYDVGTLRLAHKTLALSGTTAPHAVVEAMTGDQCLPDGPDLPGTFHMIQKADAAGHYELTGLVPGRYMLGADGWPDNYVPRCWKGVSIRSDMVRDLPLVPGGTATGRMVYASTGAPIITYLSYELTYPFGSPQQPTDEHPSRAQAKGASGRFTIDALGEADVVGRLASGLSEDQINDQEFVVIFPFQDGTPYYLTTEPMSVSVGPGIDVDLGDVEVTVH